MPRPASTAREQQDTSGELGKEDEPAEEREMRDQDLARQILSGPITA